MVGRPDFACHWVHVSYFHPHTRLSASSLCAISIHTPLTQVTSGFVAGGKKSLNHFGVPRTSCTEELIIRLPAFHAVLVRVGVGFSFTRNVEDFSVTLTGIPKE